MKILITGFDPFGGAEINPAFEAVKRLPDRLGEAQLIKLEVPTVFEKDGVVLERAIEAEKPDVVLCVGQAGGRSVISVERVAINLMEARIPDNDGQQPMDQKIKEDGENAYFTTLPVKAMVKNVKEHGIPSSISYTAGTYVCNDIMYRLLYLIDRTYPSIRGGFIHVPYLPEQVRELPDGTPSMSAELIAEGLRWALEAIISQKDEDIKEAMGTIM
ncbi:pyroglutamyl-peptidase [Lachnospiraceae bacterium PF1-21]|uniref:Pyrrolidone-carboxylate peptidase n=1 Tax=Ohessyouella blattaphilus TaxID=2949333 RepID=A0ABT1EGF1_9FIRM|nr:pyroglutamyl-peptidase I [Ohessyouella blattaphilus]MCP1108766.1 pyroglutamyl-peptidase I [Ohessyouella blattaphilus]MCR8562160.1 pyroglutamyl-peptidase I [Ohessyouella blattaphilus]MDL2250539.1 pyroglutamyl-peptidase I [Lachnospiraceae bacterium OttesenSCG-928-J05]